jgi:hypothetical protein
VRSKQQQRADDDARHTMHGDHPVVARESLNSPAMDLPPLLAGQALAQRLFFPVRLQRPANLNRLMAARVFRPLKLGFTSLDLREEATGTCCIRNVVNVV